MGSGAGRARRGGGLELELEEKESFEWAEKGRGVLQLFIWYYNTMDLNVLDFNVYVSKI